MFPLMSKRNYYEAFDGLRGLAVLMVMLYHSNGHNIFFRWGWLGVDLFFVLSGFLITEILLGTPRKTNSFKNFYLRRVFRIFPLYYFTTILFLWLSATVPQWREQWLFYKSSLLYILFNLHNWLMIFNTSHLKKEMFSHYWSLSVEEQFYFLWPFAVYFLRSLRKLEILLVSLLLVTILFRAGLFSYYRDSPKLFLAQFCTRIDGLLIGSLTAVYKFYYAEQVHKIIKRLAVVSALIYSMFVLVIKISGSSFPHFPVFGYTVVSLVFAHLMLSLINGKSSFLFRLTTNAVLKKIGKVSFGLYIYHWIFLVLLCPYIAQSLLLTKYNLEHVNMLSSVLCAILSFVTAMASYHFFEKPILKWKENYY